MKKLSRYGLKFLMIFSLVCLLVCCNFSNFSYALAESAKKEVILTDTTENVKIKQGSGFIANSPIENKNSVYLEYPATQPLFMYELAYKAQDVTDLYDAGKGLTDSKLALTFWIWIENKDDLISADFQASQIELNSNYAMDDSNEFNWAITDVNVLYSKLTNEKWNQVVFPLDTTVAGCELHGNVLGDGLNYFRMYGIPKGNRTNVVKMLLSSISIIKLDVAQTDTCVVKQTKDYVGEKPSLDKIVIPPLNNSVSTDSVPEDTFTIPKIDDTMPRINPQVKTFFNLMIIFSCVFVLSLGFLVFSIIYMKKSK